MINPVANPAEGRYSCEKDAQHALSWNFARLIVNSIACSSVRYLLNVRIVEWLAGLGRIARIGASSGPTSAPVDIPQCIWRRNCATSLLSQIIDLICWGSMSVSLVKRPVYNDRSNRPYLNGWFPGPHLRQAFFSARFVLVIDHRLRSHTSFRIIAFEL